MFVLFEHLLEVVALLALFFGVDPLLLFDLLLKAVEEGNFRVERLFRVLASLGLVLDDLSFALFLLGLYLVLQGFLFEPLLLVDQLEVRRLLDIVVIVLLADSLFLLDPHCFLFRQLGGQELAALRVSVLLLLRFLVVQQSVEFLDGSPLILLVDIAVGLAGSDRRRLHG